MRNSIGQLSESRKKNNNFMQSPQDYRELTVPQTIEVSLSNSFEKGNYRFPTEEASEELEGDYHYSNKNQSKTLTEKAGSRQMQKRKAQENYFIKQRLPFLQPLKVKASVLSRQNFKSLYSRDFPDLTGMQVANNAYSNRSEKKSFADDTVLTPLRSDRQKPIPKD